MVEWTWGQDASSGFGGGRGSGTCDEKNMDSCRQDKLISSVWEEQRASEGKSAEKEAKKTRRQGRVVVATEQTTLHILSQLFTTSSASS